MADGFQWMSIVPTLVGGTISIFTTATMFIVARHIDRREKERSQKSVEAVKALAAFDTLLQATSATINLANSIDEEFAEARERGDLTAAELHDHVRPILKAPFSVGTIAVEDCLFLVKQKNFQIYSECVAFTARVRLNEFLVDEFNSHKRQLNELLDSMPEAAQDFSSTGISYAIRGADATKVIHRVGRLNNLLGLLIANLDTDVATGKKLCEQFHEVAKHHFGSDWRVTSLKWKDVRDANP